MVYLFFFLKFKSQFRRTRPDLVRQIDEILIRSINDAGGKVTGDRFVISAVFNEIKIGFWLDIYIMIEDLKKNIEESKDFFGYSLVLSSKMPHNPDLLSRFLANHCGVFVNERVAKNFIPYAIFEKPADWLKGMKRRKYGSGSYYRIKELKKFKNTTENYLELQDDIIKIFEQDRGKNILILSPIYSQLRSCLYNYYNDLNGDFPALTVSFGSIGLGALVDAWSLSIRSLSSGESRIDDSKFPNLTDVGTGQTEEIDKLWELLFRERIRDEVSEYIVRSIKRFILLVFEYYINAAQKKKNTPVLVLENIHLAGNKVTDIFLDSLSEFNHEYKKELIILGMGKNDIPQEKLLQWESVFNKVIKIERTNQNKIFYPRLSTELWEIVYAISLFSRYFSSEFFPRLFEEDNINPIMISRALSILHTLGLIDNFREPKFISRDLEEHAINVLGEKAEKVKALVRGRLLSWAERRNLNPCFRLLTIIADIDGMNQIDDLLLLKSITSDIINGTISGIEAAMNSGQFEELVSARASAIRFIYNTTRALYSGKQEEIEKAFSNASVENFNDECANHPVLKTQILVNIGAYHLGHHKLKEAAEKEKEAILIGQNKISFCLAQAYRIFSLVYLSRQQAVETIEYLNFALTNAEKTGNYYELAISAYYSAAAQFLYGDIYNSAKFARKSIEYSLGAGCPEWADRSRFLEGRIEFELGHYRKAHEIFEDLRKEPFGSRLEEKDSLLAAWIYRCKIYFMDLKIEKPYPANNDADLFEIEAAYLSADYQRAVELSGRLINPFSKDDFLYTEQADWRSGFSQCEHLYYTHGEIQNRMISLFHSLAISRLSGNESDEALQGINNLLRDETLCEMDPWDAFYFYAKYLILKQKDANPIDLSTAVSMAFKRLQRRAVRIEDIETCRQYLNNPRWNRELSLVAKEFKLI